MRTSYRHSLDELGAVLRAMGRRGRDAVEHAGRALLDTDLDEAERALDLCEGFEADRENCETAAMTLLALQAPVAGELRQVVTTIQLVSDLSRMGALAQHLAEIARLRHPAPVVPASVRPLVTRMAAVAVELADGAIEAMTSEDPETAAGLDVADDVMDDLHETLLARILAEDWADGVVAAVDLTLIGRYYERFADHAVQVGHRIVFVATGRAAEQRESAEN
ncbi:phosphate signaling complex PhoU family protein [Nocardia takedensis]|uniref:phosphate signaling complex PhoU family protein n=1 Tax=Nocardia takedensis TaxID=259390 RepID=UPI0002FD6777|nr:PhoU domain-containing protein [Nocardia takedensis]